MGKLNVPAGEYAISPKRKFRDLSEEFIEENKDFIVKIPVNELIYDRDNEKYYGEITDESVQDMALDMSTDWVQRCNHGISGNDGRTAKVPDRIRTPQIHCSKMCWHHRNSNNHNRAAKNRFRACNQINQDEPAR